MCGRGEMQHAVLGAVSGVVPVVLVGDQLHGLMVLAVAGGETCFRYNWSNSSQRKI